jgi:hypothetical protein
MRPKTKEYDKLDKRVLVRLTKLEQRLLVRRCKEEGYQNMSDFCRAKLVKRREIRKIEVSEEFVKMMDYDLNKIGVNLNQIAKSINSTQVYQFGASDREVFIQVSQELGNCFSILENYFNLIE